MRVGVLTQALHQVFAEMRGQKLRFALNVSAFVIGGTCLIALAGLMESGKRVITAESHAAAGDDQVTIEPVAPPIDQARRTRREVTSRDADALSSAPRLESGLVSSERHGWLRVSHQNRWRYLEVSGTGRAVLATYRLSVANGRFFTDHEVASAARVAVVGAHLFRDLLDGQPHLASLKIRVGGTSFRVIGVLEEKPSLGASGPWSWDEKVIVPWTTFRSCFQNAADRGRVSVITWRASGVVGEVAPALRAARWSIDRLLDWRHFGVRNFEVKDPGEDTESDLVAGIVAGLLLTTAIVSFVVGGFTITNASLASVAQRSREIGIKRAVGATRQDIVLEFVLETAASALLGGTASLATGVGLTWLVSQILATQVPGWQLVIPAWSLLGATLLALLVGAGAGVYPASRAAALDPIQALRSY